MSKLFTMKVLGKSAYIVGFLAASLVGVNTAHAQTDAYSIQIAVTDRSVGEQKNAYQVAMRKVLLANSGDKTLLNRDEVREGLRSADTYVESFRYDTPEPGTVISRDTPLTDSVRKSGKATLLMMIDFNRELIQELILKKASDEEAEEAPDPFSNVSSALMWLLIEDGERQILISSLTAQNVMDRAREIAGAAGILLTFPSGSDKDVDALIIEDITDANLEPIAALASRYAQRVTLAAHLSRTLSGTWEGQWLKSAAGEHESQALSAVSLDQALQEGIAWLKPQSFRGAAGAATTNSTTRSSVSGAEGLVWVSPLRSTAEYAKVIDLLSSVDGVDSVYPKEVLDTGMLFSIMPRSVLPLVSEVLSSSDILREAATPTAASESRFASGISVSFEYLR